MRRACIRPGHSGLVPRGRMPVVSLDDANGGARCGGVLTARREDGHAHGLEGKEAFGQYGRRLSRGEEGVGLENGKASFSKT